MIMKTRDENLKTIFSKVTEAGLQTMLNGYSDTALTLIAGIPDIYIVKILSGNLSVSVINKLADAVKNEKISDSDFLHILKYAPVSKRNEKYIDDFLSSIDEGENHEYATKIYAAVGYDKCTYKEALELVHTGAIYPTDYAEFSIDAAIVRELWKMSYPLRACEDFNSYYDIDSSEHLEEAIKRNVAFVISNKSLTVAIMKAMQRDDWSNFRDYIVDEMGESVTDLHDIDITNLYESFVREMKCTKLYDKVKAEYDIFISAIQNETVGVAIESAYEIVWKDNFTQYLENETPELSIEQFDALIASTNTLDEIYNEWLSNGELHSYDDIGIVLEETADILVLAAKERQQEGS